MHLARASLAAILASTASLAYAGLKSKAPEGVTLGGTEWQLDRYSSDDPEAALVRAAREQRRPDGPTRPADGGVFGGDDPFGRSGARRDPIGSRSGAPGDPERGGVWSKDRGSNSAEIDPTGEHQSITLQMGTPRLSILFEPLRTNPDRLTFAEGKQYMTVNADGLETECQAGAKEPFSDSYGNGERSCGWNGHAWVIETSRGREFSRTDRYEISKDGKTLKYTTSASGDGISRVTITRRYSRAPAAK